MSTTYKFYKIWNKQTQEYESAMIGAGTNRTQDEFYSINEARKFNCHGLFEDKMKYEIHEFITTSNQLNINPPSEEEIQEYLLQEERRKSNKEEFEKYLNDNFINKYLSRLLNKETNNEE